MNYIDNVLMRHKELEYLRESIVETVEAIKKAYYKGGKILVCGNGGSCSDADHIVGELLKGFLSKRELTKEQKSEIINKNYDNGNYIADSLQQGIIAYSLNAQGAILSAVINDIGSDMVSHKKTLCCRFGDKFKGLYFLYGLFAIGYLSILWFGVVTENYWVLLTFLTLPYSISLCKSLVNYHTDKSIVPVPKWWQKPLDNWENLVNNGTASFYFVLFQSRNLVIWFCIILIFALILG